MNIVEHLNQITSALDELDVSYLVMGGHAVRYYGFRRETTDHDLYIPAEIGRNLSELLSRTALLFPLHQSNQLLGAGKMILKDTS